jgi:hypothetical protein
MKLNIVNSQEKDLVYSVTDTSPEFNLPRLSDDELLLIGDDKNCLKQYDAEARAELYKDNGLIYNLYIRPIHLIGSMTEEEKLSAMSDMQDHALTSLIDYFHSMDIFKIGSGQLSFDNWHSIWLPTGYVDGFGQLLNDSEFSLYEKNEMLSAVVLPLYECYHVIQVLTGYIPSTYALTSELSLPKMADLSSIQDVCIPSIDELGEYELPSIDIPILEPPALLTSKADTWETDIDALCGQLDEIKEVEQMRSRVNTIFAAYDAFESKYVDVDSVTIENEEVQPSNEYVSGHLVKHTEGIFPNYYTMRIMKDNYQTVKLSMTTQICKDSPDLFDIGVINLIRRTAYPFKLYFAWGFFPADLDVHIYGFDDTLIEHSYFDNKVTESIDLDRDDVDAWGPEIITLKNNGLWYLVAVHNYTLAILGDDEYAHMNIDGKTRVSCTFYGHTVTVVPPDSDKYWWNALVIHDDYVYVLNEFPNDRDFYHSSELSDEAIATIKEHALASNEIYKMSDYIPKDIIRLERP